jgi:hypothetical protein
MSAYDEHLSKVFVVCIVAREDLVREMIDFLLSSRGEVSNGSSFAVTSDTYELGKRKLWLSRVSYETLFKLGYVSKMEFSH